MLNKGNIKVAYPLFSLPSGRTCPGRTPMCERFCYAKKAERLYPSVVKSRERNLEMSQSRDFVALMNRELKESHAPFIRIHESGDFYNQRYLNKWIRICKSNPDKQFLAFTKSYHLDYSKVPENLVLYFSVWPDSKWHRGIPPDIARVAYTVVKGEKMAMGKAKKCKGKCMDCLHCFLGKGDVWFEKH